MDLLKRVFGQKKTSYKSRTYVGTPGGFHNRRSPSDILITSHPSPGDYQEHLDSVEYQSRRDQAMSFLSEQSITDGYASEDLYEDQSDGYSDDTTEAGTICSAYSLEEEDKHEVPAQRRYVPAVNKRTAQEQWDRLQQSALHNKEPKRKVKPVPVYYQRPAPSSEPSYRASAYRQAPVAQAQRAISNHHYQAQPSHQTAVSCQAPLKHHPVPQRVSFLPQRRHYSEPASQPCKIISAATMTALAVYGDENGRSYHETASDRHRTKGGLAPFPYRMVGGIPIHPAVPGS